MAKLTAKRLENIEGNFYVDHSCINCDTCRWIAPEIFYQAGEKSAVFHQPQTETEILKAFQALLSCPTSSIGTVEKPKEIKKIQDTFPILIDNNVYHCGYHSELSFGAASYFIQRPEGNILIDSPRFTPPLVKKFEAMGGIKYLYLTHRDDVADHEKYHQHFNCDRLLHEDDISEKTKNVEIKLTGDQPINLASDLLIIPVSGHTKGHTVLLYQNQFLFTGDHLAWSDYLKQLIAFHRHCWYSWEKLKESMQKLTQYQFTWILPGHGRRYHASNAQQMQEKLTQCLEWMYTVKP